MLTKAILYARISNKEQKGARRTGKHAFGM